MVYVIGSGNLFADRRYELARQYAQVGEWEVAVDLISQALEMAPDWPPLTFFQGELLMKLERHAEAVKAFTTYLTLDSKDSLGAIIKLALLGSAPKPETLPPSYIENLFNQYAPHFEQALVERLEYRVPWLLADIVDVIRPVGAEASDRVLDLGCGTGLGGEAFYHRAAWLEGVDLSCGMLAEAEGKKLYQSLKQQDAIAFLQNTDKTYDLIIATDLLVYLGPLEELFRALSGKLAPGGLFAFSTQYSESGSYMLGADHRFAHSSEYIRFCAEKSGLRNRHFSVLPIRKDGIKAISGNLCVLEKQSQELPMPETSDTLRAIAAKRSQRRFYS